MLPRVFLFENQSLIKIQIGHAHHEPYVVHFLSEKRPMIDFHRENGWVQNRVQELGRELEKLLAGPPRRAG